MAVAMPVELVAVKTTIYLCVQTTEVEKAAQNAVIGLKLFISRLYQADHGIRNLRAEMLEPQERKDEPGIFDIIALMRADVPTGIRVLGADTFMDAYRQILKETLARTTRELADVLHRKCSFIALTRQIVPGEDEQQDDAADKPKRMVPVVAIIGGVTHNVEINAEDTILDGILDRGIDLKFQCKAGVCDECEIRILEGSEHLPPVNDSEVNMLGDKTQQGHRLSCQITCKGPIKFSQP